eukprot:scaffold27148_cov36-Phaeocystis_antarctica.AAC.3
MLGWGYRIAARAWVGRLALRPYSVGARRQQAYHACRTARRRPSLAARGRRGGRRRLCRPAEGGVATRATRGHGARDRATGGTAGDVRRRGEVASGRRCGGGEQRGAIDKLDAEEDAVDCGGGDES